jgi:hypothetical protein
VEGDGELQVPAQAAEKAERILLGPSVDTLTLAERQRMVTLRADEILIKGKLGTISLAPPDVARLPLWRRCVSGSVEKCSPWWLWERLVEATPTRLRLSSEPARSSLPLQSIERARPIIFPPWRRCDPICDGTVTVYHRYCCCRPWVIEDPRLEALLERLRQVVVKRPPIPPVPPEPGPPWIGPIGPGPDPGPESVALPGLGLLQSGTLNEALLNSEHDLAALEAMEPARIPDFVASRPYLRPLWCSCGAPIEVGQGSIRPDGTFTVCWFAPPIIIDFCIEEFSFVVRQSVNGQTVVIYDGPGTGKWFNQTSGIVLESWDYRALSCRQEDGPDGDGAFVLLQDIGGTPSYQLKTPDATGPDRVAAPAFNDGLLYPVATAALAQGNQGNSNLGGTLALRYKFSEEMRAIGARYYRISVAPADASGSPTTAPTALNLGLAWLWYEMAGATINVLSESLGPLTVGAEQDLFTVPYNADHDWQSGQFHGYLDTTRFPDGRFLLTVEVFDGAGQRLRPAGSGGPGLDAAFTYRRWFQELGPTAEVPFAALTHMLWWDNRAPVAQIVDLRMDDQPSTDECQFRSGTVASQFSAGYRAYHPEPMFMLEHHLWWRRGLGGPTGGDYVVTQNAGQPPDPLAIYPGQTFGTMLDGRPRCTFALNLHVDVKTTNGWGRLVSLERNDEASFALETN